MFYPKNSLIQNFHSFFSFKSDVARFHIVNLKPKDNIILENYMMSGVNIMREVEGYLLFTVYCPFLMTSFVIIEQS